MLSMDPPLRYHDEARQIDTLTIRPISYGSLSSTVFVQDVRKNDNHCVLYVLYFRRF